MNKLHSDKASSQEPQFQMASLLSLPNELLFRIMSFLSTGSIRNLTTNRTLRPICESHLYQNISLASHPRRSIRLLETFALRPDLALLVRHLGINFSWIFPDEFPRGEVPSILQPHGLQALSLVKNINSLSLHGGAAWIWGPDIPELREVIFNMKLVRLEMSLLDQYMHCPNSGAMRRWDGDLGQRIGSFLQAQPRLEQLHFSHSGISGEAVNSLKRCLNASDLCSLRSLQVGPFVAMAFLPIAPRLESLNLTMSQGWTDSLWFELETASTGARFSIRRFVINGHGSDEWLWKNLARVFGLFPNTEELSIAVYYRTGMQHAKRVKCLFQEVADNVSVLTLLRHIELRYLPELSRFLEVEQGALADFRTACPSLETMVDPANRLWVFQPDSSSSLGFVPQLVGPLMECSGPVDDFSAPEENGT